MADTDEPRISLKMALFGIGLKALAPRQRLQYDVGVLLALVLMFVVLISAVEADRRGGSVAFAALLCLTVAVLAIVRYFKSTRV